MAQPFVGEIKMFAGNFAINGYAFCNGQLMSIAENDVLFALIGTTYGGDGQTTFGLPDMQGRIPLHQGQGPGLTSRTMGEKAGTETVTLISQQMPSHSHTAAANSGSGASTNPQSNFIAGSTSTPYNTTAPATQMGVQTIGLMGGSQAHDNLQPYLVITYLIALYGIFPPRN